MLPKNSKHYIEPTAEKLGLDSQFVEDVVSFYYSALRKALVNLESHNIQVEKLGTFKVKKKEIPKIIKKYKKHLSVVTKDTFSQMQIRKELTEKLERAERLQELINADKERKKKFLYEKIQTRLKENMEK